MSKIFSKELKLKETSHWIFSLYLIKHYKDSLTWNINSKKEVISKWNKFELLWWKERYSNFLLKDLIVKSVIDINNDDWDEILRKFKIEYQNIFWFNSLFEENSFEDSWLDLFDWIEEQEWNINNLERRGFYRIFNFKEDQIYWKELKLHFCKYVDFDLKYFIDNFLILKEILESHKDDQLEFNDEIKRLKLSQFEFEGETDIEWFKSFNKFSIEFYYMFEFNRKSDSPNEKEIVLKLSFFNDDTKECLKIKIYLDDVTRKNSDEKRYDEFQDQEYSEKDFYYYEVEINSENDLFKSLNSFIELNSYSFKHDLKINSKDILYF